jgi:tape measure domain-containing protein
MSTTVDQRVVEMRFDNKQFENNIQTSLSSIDKLKKSLNMDGATKGLESVEKASGKINLSGLSNAVETVNAKFSALEVMAITALANITNSAVNAGKSIVSALTIDPIKTGFQEYETQINAVQTILANTSSKGTTLDQVNNALDELNHYADMTIYNFTEMTRNIGTFTAAGVDLDTSVSAIKGIANLAAVSGSNSQQASTAMYQLSQALAAGTVKLQDWNSVVNAGMGGQVFQDALKETARVHGIAIDDMIKDEGSFRETLQKGWLTSDILTETLSKFTGDLNEEQLRTMGYSEEQIASIIKMGQTANDAATKVKTFSQLFDTLKEAAQSGWTQSWEIIVGDFEEAKELLTEMSDTFSAIINSSADARNSMLQGWKDLGGRTAFIEAARNAFEGVLSIIKPVKEAFREIFPPMTAQQLYNITDALRNLTAHLKLSDTNSENLKRTFKGLFAVIDIVKQAFVAVAKGVGSLLGGTGDLASSILSVTARFGDWLVKLDETIKKTDIFNVAIQTVIKYIKTGVAVATDLIDKAVDAVTRFANAIKQKYDTGGFAVIHSVLERVHTRMSEVGEAADGMRSGVEIAIGAMGKALENSKFLQALQALLDGVKTIGTGITKAMKILASGFVEDISDINFSSVFDVLSGISLAGIAVGINKFLKGITDAVSDVTKLTDQIKGILDSVRGCFEAYQTQLKAGTLIKIASAIAILTGAIVVLSLIDSAKLASAITALTGLFAELMASMAIFTKISGDLKKATKTVTIMLGLSVSVLILASALKKIASLSWNEIAKGLRGITVVSGVLVGVAKVISKDEKTIAKGAFNLIFLATAVKILASACKDISQLSWGELAKGLTGVGVLMAEIALFLNTANFSGKAVSTATGMLVLSAAIKVLASACIDFGSMQWSEIGKGLKSIGILLTEIAVFTNLTGNAKHVVSTGVALIAIAGAMKIMASAVQDFGSMQWKEIAKGLVTMRGALAELSIALNFMNGTLAGSAALLIASASLAVLAPVLSILGAMSWEAITKGLVSLAGAFAIIGVAGAVLSPIVPSILALAGAFTLIGVGVGATGAGLLAAGLGLQALAIGLTAIAAAGTAGATALVAALAVIITGVADLIPAVLVKLAEGIAQFCVALAGAAPQILESLVVIITACLAAISNVVPQLVEVLVTLLVTTLQTLAEHTSEIVQAVFDILIACLQGIADNIGMVVQTAIDIVLNFIDGIAQKLPDVIQSGVNLLLSFIEGIISAIDNNSERLANDIRNLFKALIRAAVLVLTGGVVDIKEVGSKIMNSGLISGIKEKLSNLKETVHELISNAKQVIQDKINDFKDVGKHIIGGLISGITDKASDLANSAINAAKSAVNGVKNFLGIHSPSRVFAEIGRYTDEGFINGVKAYAGKVSDATVDMGKGAVRAMSDTLSTIADLVDSDIDSEPTIRPVMDLSNIQNGANQLFSMMKSVDGYSLSGSLDIANRTGSRINEVRNKAIDNSSMLDKISDAVGNFNSGNSFENTFNITGSNPKEIAEEVSNIIQRQVERRDASWA